jgi:signal peptidase I
VRSGYDVSASVSPWRREASLLRRHRRRNLIVLGCAAAIGISVVTKLGWSSYTVSSASMEPTLHCAASPRCKSLTADRVMANRWIYLVHPVQRRDVVVLKGAKWCGDGGLVVKRIIGVPGDRVRVDGRAVYLNGGLVTPEMAANRNRVQSQSRVRALRVSDGHYFVLGDNTDVACDSRTRGTVPRGMIVGKAVLIWSPFERMRFL